MEERGILYLYHQINNRQHAGGPLPRCDGSNREYLYHDEYRSRVFRFAQQFVIFSPILFLLLVSFTACTQKVFRIGVIAPTSGTLTDRGVAYLRGAELAAEEHTNGLLQVELTARNPRNSHYVARRFAEELIYENRVDALLAPPVPALAEAVLSLKSGSPMVTTEPISLSPCQFSLALPDKVGDHARVLFGSKGVSNDADASATAANSAENPSDYRARLYHADDPRIVVQRFVEDYRARYGSPPDLYAAFGYDAVSILVLLFNKWSRSNSDICSGFLSSSWSFTGVTGEIRWSSMDSRRRYIRSVAIIDISQSLDLFLGRIEIGVDRMIGM